MYSQLLVYHSSADLEAIFHFRRTVGLVAPVVGFARVISPARHLLSSHEEIQRLGHASTMQPAEPDFNPLCYYIFN